MEEKETTFLGRGWHFPPTFDKYSTTVQMSENEEDIQESIGILLSTEPGERVMLPDYGADMKQLLFEPLDTRLSAYMESRIKDSITLHEPRVKLEKVTLTPIQEEGKINIAVEYTIVTTNTRYNNVFPYYLNEANNL
jgi:phage baseplate assembly protein W